MSSNKSKPWLSRPTNKHPCQKVWQTYGNLQPRKSPFLTLHIQILDRVNNGLEQAGDLIFNCQMGRGRTTTGMVCAGLVAHVLYGDYRMEDSGTETPLLTGSQANAVLSSNRDDGVSEEEAYLNGTCPLFLIRYRPRLPAEGLASGSITAVALWSLLTILHLHCLFFNSH